MSEVAFLLAWPVLGFFVALPALGAWHRRRRSREASDVARELAEFAAARRDAPANTPLGDALRARLLRLRLADVVSLQLAEDLRRGESEGIADAAQRLATRLRRRVAFERKMLARTAPGLRRGAVAAALPPLLMQGASFVGMPLQSEVQMALLLAEAAGCVLLWRLAHVEI